MLDDLSMPHFAGSDGIAARQRWLGILSRASFTAIETLMRNAPALSDHVVLRGPETGMAMLRGRIGGGGAAFNLGEMTMSRCSIRDAGGWIGHGYASGRDASKVELIARLDAALQNPATHDVWHRSVVATLQAEQSARHAVTEAEAARTDVKFFTLATMRT
jgi:alpha-D-ribose 1-methylphosphonate 5-triphosphate synthase subunit PhnG